MMPTVLAPSATLVDPAPGIQLDKLHPLSKRARSLLARCRRNRITRDHLKDLLRLIATMEALEYHHARFVDVLAALASGAANDPTPLDYEAAAYLHRLRDWWRFAVSDLGAAQIDSESRAGLEQLLAATTRNGDARSVLEPRMLAPKYPKSKKKAKDPRELWTTHNVAYEVKRGLGEKSYYLVIARDHDAMVEDAYKLLHVLLRRRPAGKRKLGPRPKHNFWIIAAPGTNNKDVQARARVVMEREGPDFRGPIIDESLTPYGQKNFELWMLERMRFMCLEAKDDRAAALLQRVIDEKRMGPKD